jgi:hypothetical protein
MNDVSNFTATGSGMELAPYSAGTVSMMGATLKLEPTFSPMPEQLLMWALKKHEQLNVIPTG